MAQTLAAARRNDVIAGAHPSYPDREGFGRRTGFTVAAELIPELCKQLEDITAVAQEVGVCLCHVKPHGALYNDAARDRDLAVAICDAVMATDPSLAVVGLPGSELAHAARSAGLRFIAEGFVDRAYTAKATLVPRSEPGSVYSDPAEAARQALEIATTGSVKAMTGETVPVDVETLCIHGDSPGAVASATAVVDALAAAGVRIAAPGR